MLRLSEVRNWNPHNLTNQEGEPITYIPDFVNFQLTLQKELLKKFEESENKISIIIQGPLNRRSINTIPSYLNYGEVVLSYWDKDDKELLNEVSSKVKLIENKVRDVSSFLFKTNNKTPFAYQYFSTLRGLINSSGNLSIKTRSDESFPNLDLFVKNMKHNMNSINEKNSYNSFKITSCNIYFRKDRDFKFHPSDHLLGGSKSRLISIFDKCLNKCKQNNTRRKTPEQLIGTSAIETYLDPITKNFDVANPVNSIDLMKKHFSIVRIKDLPESTWTSSYRMYTELRGEEDWCHDINEIDT